ncbi:MAG: hypothetical protein HDS04_03720 [Bacteroides sp.]|nr:hypothetical protein [Bacteroides sp.]MBD5328252.1 hypothetical protein [Bacteroides sp.]MBD5328259.1 hypothetical protein [Bacteroides sp.]
MKIETTTYTIRDFSKKDIRLNIGLSITTDVDVINSSVDIQLYPIASFQGRIPEEAFSLLLLSAIVYSIDRSVNRHKYSIDGWTREFDVDINLPACDRFKQSKTDIEQMLSFLTGDYWCFNFAGDTVVEYPNIKLDAYYDNITQVNLFSGGLDSLIGAIDYVAHNPNGKLYLSSHYDSYMTGPKIDQSRVRKELIEEYGKSIVYHEGICITPGVSKETSCRSRSLVFIALANIVASYAKCDVVIPENGSVSLNFPLSHSRRAACSTRTTHPIFLSQFQTLLVKLGLSTRIYNPYEFMTKGEMVKDCANMDLLIRTLPLSNSCGKRNMHQHMFDNSKATHCAHCMPCMYRKAATIGIKDLTSYGNKLQTIFLKKSNAVSNDFYAMLDFLKKDLTHDEIRRELHVAGMAGFSDLDSYIDLVIRTRAELSNMLRKENSTLINQYMGWE